MNTNKARSFSVELKSKRNLKTINVSNGSHEGVLIEGSLGKLRYTNFIEGVILEIVGTTGAFRIDVCKSEIIQQDMQKNARTEETKKEKEVKISEF